MDNLLNDLSEVLEQYDSSIAELSDLIIKYHYTINPLYTACEVIAGPDDNDVA